MNINKNKKIIISIVSVLILLFGLGAYGYKSESKNALATGLQNILPAFFIGNNTISISEWNEMLDIARRLDPEVSESKVVEQQTKIIKAKILAEELNLDWEPSLNPEIEFYTKGNADEFSGMIQEYFSGSQKLFVKFLAEPSVVEAVLQMHFNSLNKGGERDIALALLDKIKNGENFEALAKSRSDDKVSGQFGGDLGFFEEGMILPELFAQIKKGPMGEVQKEIFTSRFGHHVVYPVETAERDGKTLWHAKHILVRAGGYEKWFAEMTKNIKVRQLVKIN